MAHQRMQESPITRVEVRPRRGLSREMAAAYIGVGVTKFDELIAQKLMPEGIRIGGRVVWDIRRLDDAFDDLAAAKDAKRPEANWD
jgi:predicted DNA-binding transcriptional regulator AlpA